MQFVNITNIGYWLLIMFLWGAGTLYILISAIKAFRENSRDKRLKSIKNYKAINPFVRLGINSFIIINILLLSSIIIFRPVFGTEQTEGSSTNLDIALLVDISLSMNVKDYDDEKSRLDGAKEILTDMLSEDTGNRYSLISFHSSAEVEMPLTFDKNTALTGLDTLHIVDSYASSGSSMNDALLEAQKRLINEKDTLGQNRKKIIILVTDGEEVGGKVVELDETIDELNSNNIRIYTLGIGTEQGDKIPDYKFLDGSESYIWFDGEYPISKLDEEKLKEIASDGGGKYFHGTPNFDEREILDELANAAQFVDISEGNPVYKDSYFLFTPFILFLLLYLHIEPHNYIMELRKRR